MAVWLQGGHFPSLGLSFPHLHNEGAGRDLREKRGTQRDKEGKGEERSGLTKVCRILPDAPGEESVGGRSGSRPAEVLILPPPPPTPRPTHPSPAPEACLYCCLLAQEPGASSQGPQDGHPFSLTIRSGSRARCHRCFLPPSDPSHPFPAGHLVPESSLNKPRVRKLGSSQGEAQKAGDVSTEGPAWARFEGPRGRRMVTRSGWLSLQVSMPQPLLFLISAPDPNHLHQSR